MASPNRWDPFALWRRVTVQADDAPAVRQAGWIVEVQFVDGGSTRSRPMELTRAEEVAARALFSQFYEDRKVARVRVIEESL